MSNQQDLVENLFKQTGADNYIQASFFSELGKELSENCPNELRKTAFPEPKIINSEEWLCAYSIVKNYLETNNMKRTQDVFVAVAPNVEAPSISQVQQVLSINDNQNPLDILISS